MGKCHAYKMWICYFCPVQNKHSNELLQAWTLLPHKKIWSSNKPQHWNRILKLLRVPGRVCYRGLYHAPVLPVILAPVFFFPIDERIIESYQSIGRSFVCNFPNVGGTRRLPEEFSSVWTVFVKRKSASGTSCVERIPCHFLTRCNKYSSRFDGDEKS